MTKQEELQLAAQYFEEGEKLTEKVKYKESIEVLEKTSAIYERWEKWEKWVEANNLKGRNLCNLGEYNTGIEFLEEVLKTGKIYLEENNIQIAQSWNNLAICHWYKGDYNPTIAYLQTAYKIRKTCGDDIKVAESLSNLGVCYEDKGEYELAISTHHEALAIFQKYYDSNDLRINNALENMAACYQDIGDYDQAISIYYKASTILNLHLDNTHPRIASNLANLSTCFSQKGDYELALDYSIKSLQIREALWGNNHPKLIDSIINLGRRYYVINNYASALKYFQRANTLYTNCIDKNHFERGRLLTYIGLCYQQERNYDKSILYFEEGLHIYQKHFGNKHPDLADPLSGLAATYFAKGDYLLSFENSQKALSTLIVNKFDSKNIYQNPDMVNFQHGGSLLILFHQKSNLFYQYYTHQTHNLKDLQSALSTIRLATDLITNIRQSYKAEGSKYTLAEKAANTYNLAIEIALKTAEVYQTLPSIPQHPEFTNIPYTAQGCKNLTFNFSEQSKAILLLSSLKDSEAKTTSNIPLTLLEKEKQLKIELNYLDKSIATQESKSEQKDEELLSKFQSQYFDFKQEYDQLIDQFETDYPEYYRLKYAVETASVEEVQKHLSSIPINSEGFKSLAIDGVALISYHIAEKNIYIFAITSNNYQIHTLEKPSNFPQLIANFQNTIPLMNISEYIHTAGDLYDLLLQPVLEKATKIKKLIIIPHNELTTVAFDALIDRRKMSKRKRVEIIVQKDFPSLPYLVKDYDISYHYSATMLLHSVARQEQKPSKSPSFVGFAPVNFNGSGDVELALMSSRGQTKVMRSNKAGETALAQLPNTENEVKEVFNLFEAKELNAQAFLYASANKENLFENASNHKYVLIATHGYAQDGNAGLSGIYLASKGEVSDTYNSYLLHTSEAYHLQLNADLVVLSSCSSGVGKLIAGEGMMAINRGFLYAGASNIIFTQFDIPDASSGELVKKLFSHILESSSQNGSYASALRKAKVALLSDSLKTPEDWAGYALIGG